MGVKEVKETKETKETKHASGNAKTVRMGRQNPNTRRQSSPDRDARRPISQRGAGGGGSMGHSRWRALRGYLIWSQERLRTAAARKPGRDRRFHHLTSTRRRLRFVSPGRAPQQPGKAAPGCHAAQLGCAACAKAHKRAAWGASAGARSSALLATA